MSLLILSDGRMGHVNQSIAFAKYLNQPYDIVEVSFKQRLMKPLSYLFDNLYILTSTLFNANITKQYNMVIGTGSSTYYAVKVLAKKMNAKSIVMMLPKGYCYDFSLIFAQEHDNPTQQKNIVITPANFSYIEPKGIYYEEKKSIGIVIGGDNAIFKMSKTTIQAQLDFIQKYYGDYRVAITTSPRTSNEIEKLVASYNFHYELIFSKTPLNPIPDFLEQCETVFITADSTSMISEAISYGKSNVIVLPLESQKSNKFKRFIQNLEEEKYLHIFDGSIKNRNKKIDFKAYTEGLNI